MKKNCHFRQTIQLADLKRSVVLTFCILIAFGLDLCCVVLIVFRTMVFHIKLYTITSGCSIVYIEGAKFITLTKYFVSSLKIDFV